MPSRAARRLRRSLARRLSLLARERWGNVVAVATGLLLGLVASAGGIPGVAVATLVGGALAILATSAIAEESRRVSAAIVALAVGYAFIVYRSPNVTVLEVLVAGPTLVVLLQERKGLAAGLRAEPLVRLFAAASAVMIALGALYVVWRPAHLGAGAPLKELGKNLEIAFLAAGVFAYTRTFERFARVYALLAMIALVSAMQPLYWTRGHGLSGDALMTQAPLVFIVLTLPFVRNLSVSALVAASGVLLVVARTRGAWIMAALLLVAVGIRQWRHALLSRGGVVLLGGAAALVVAAVAVIPKARDRFTALVSGHDASVGTRSGMAHAGIDEAVRYPLTGVGPGQFKEWLLIHGSPVNFRIGLEQIPKDPHDVFVKFLAEMGFPGLLAILGWSIAVVAAAIVAWRRLMAGRGESPEHDLRPYMIGIALYTPVFVAMLALSEWGSLTRIQLAISAGLLLALLRFSPVHPTDRGAVA